MRVYWGKLYANLRVFSGLHLGHVSASYCVLGSGRHARVQKITDLNIKTPLMEKAVMGNEPKGLFPSITGYLWVKHFTSDSFSREKQWLRQTCSFTVSSLVWLCTALLLPISLTPRLRKYSVIYLLGCSDKTAKLGLHCRNTLISD